MGAGHFIDKLSDPVDFVKEDDDPLHLFGLIENRFSGIQQVNIPGGRVDNNLLVDQLESRSHHPPQVESVAENGSHRFAFQRHTPLENMAHLIVDLIDHAVLVDRHYAAVD